MSLELDSLALLLSRARLSRDAFKATLLPWSHSLQGAVLSPESTLVARDFNSSTGVPACWRIKIRVEGVPG